jgi:molybdenum cofactor guanylyltransferase
MKHQKHTKLTKPNIGQFARNEWAIMGTSCGNIQKLAVSLNENLTSREIGTGSQYKTAYVDADHKSGDEGENLPYFMAYTDKINFNRFDFQGKITDFQYRSFFNETDLVLINGNHFKGNRQIVVLDEKKFESLNRKLDKLTQVDAFLTLDVLARNEATIPDFLKEYIKNWAEIPVFNIGETDKIGDFLIKNITISPISALILVGGKSTRMGRDKSQIDYHGKPQWQYVGDILRGLDLDVFISCRDEQMPQYEGENVITDTFMDLGPYGAILSAFRENPNTAWLVVACDLPLLDKSTLENLIKNRNPSAVATTYRSPESAEGFPEPLITIWEPKSYPILLQFLAQGFSCPRKVLINSDTHIIDPSVPEALTNVNTPDEMKMLIGC